MKIWLFIAAINGFLAVAAGAFGAHGLQGRLEPHALTTFETGARYHMYHAIAMAIAAVGLRGDAAQLACALYLLGIILFSGSLYLLALTDVRVVGFVTPIGGVTLLGGWIAFAWAAIQYRSGA